MNKPVRLQLSRKRGFSLQRLSLATNGLPAVNVARPSRYGNAFAWDIYQRTHGVSEQEAKRWAVNAFRNVWTAYADGPYQDYLRQLRGKNLACWCAIGEPCHADVLLELANA